MEEDVERDWGVPYYCPICGEELHDGDCDPLRVNTQRKPVFSTIDLRQYKEEHLIKIIEWYDERCRILEERFIQKRFIQKWRDGL
jgi:hypothetical protein